MAVMVVMMPEAAVVGAVYTCPSAVTASIASSAAEMSTILSTGSVVVTPSRVTCTPVIRAGLRPPVVPQAHTVPSAFSAME